MGGWGGQFQMSWVQFLVDYIFTRALQLSETRGQMKRPVSTSRSPAGNAVEASNQTEILSTLALGSQGASVGSHHITQQTF